MIAQALVEKGILQIGLFQHENTTRPYRLRLEMLPAYPTLLEEISRQVIRQFSEENTERIVADTDVMPIGVLLSTALHIPLVYSRGRGELPVHDLIGAYDVGHPAVLLVGEVTSQTQNLIQNCQRVGLEIQQVIALLGEARTEFGLPVIPILDFASMIEELSVAGLLPLRQAQAMQSFQP